MGWFSNKRKRPTCDWCGLPIEGSGVVAASGLTVCSEPCRAASDAPPIERREGEDDRPTATLDGALIDFTAASERFDEYMALLAESARTKSRARMDKVIARAEMAYAESWRHLAEVAQIISELGADTERFATLRDFGFGYLQDYEIETTETLSGRAVTASVAIDASSELFTLAAAELCHRMDEVALANDRPALFDVGPPDEARMAAALESCESRREDAGTTPDDFSVF